MSLNFNVTKIANYRENFPDRVEENGQHHWNDVTYAITWLAIPCAWGWELTEKNYKEAFVRISMWEKTHGAFRSKLGRDDKPEEVFITMEDVKKHIGFHVNVSPITNGQFAKLLAKSLRDAAESELRYQEAASEAEGAGR